MPFFKTINKNTPRGGRQTTKRFQPRSTPPKYFSYISVCGHIVLKRSTSSSRTNVRINRWRRRVAPSSIIRWPLGDRHTRRQRPPGDHPRLQRKTYFTERSLAISLSVIPLALSFTLFLLCTSAGTLRQLITFLSWPRQNIRARPQTPRSLLKEYLK